MEQWKYVVGYEGYYKISNRGRVMNASGLRTTWYSNL